MKVDFASPIVNLDGSVVPGEDGEPLTLAALAMTVLLEPLLDPTGKPENLASTEKMRFGMLAQTIFKSDAPLDITAEDVTLLKDRIGRAYKPLAVMRAWDILDPRAGG